ncbi:MAG: LPS assembly lipoprotein LptE [Candidatus Polarisedimenticolaceae bacterium]|nr:LPS assembly lipoprotein LptE [Candidatus Polarisedimenticolaceae bacterium]
MHKKSRLFIAVLVVSLLTLLQGCGFQLRGAAELPPSISPLYLQGMGEHDPLRRDLRQVFEGANIQLTSDQSKASSTLHITKQEQDRRVLSVDSRGKVVEYEIHQALEFELLDADGVSLMERQSVGSQRAYENPETGILGKDQEEKLLRRDLRLDLVRRIAYRIQEQFR